MQGIHAHGHGHLRVIVRCMCAVEDDGNQARLHMHAYMACSMLERAARQPRGHGTVTHKQKPCRLCADHMTAGWTPLRCTHCTVRPEPGPRGSAGQPRQGMQRRGESAIACSAWTCLVRRLGRHQLPSAFAATPQPLPACRRLGFHELQHAVVHVCQGQCVTRATCACPKFSR